MNWYDAADAKLQIYNFWTSEVGRLNALAFAKAIGETNPNSLPLYKELDGLEALVMSRSEPIWVAPEIMDVVEVAAETFQPEPFVESDLVTPSGFVLLPRPVYIPDATGKKVTFRAFSWYPSKGPGPGAYSDTTMDSVWMSFYSHIEDIVDEDDGVQLKARVLRDQSVYGYSTPWVFLHGMVVPFGLSPTDWVNNAARKEGYTDETMMNATNAWWQFVQALLRLSMQKMTVRTGTAYPRAARRRAERAGLSLDPDDMIMVITLRRPKNKYNGDGEGDPINYTHRWIVGGHWRNQYYPSLGMHRQIYISDYVKGPEHLPLAVRKGRAFNFVQ